MAEIETERLLLRHWRDQDLDAYARICADTEVTRYLGRGPLSREQSRQQLTRFAAHWQRWGYGLWAVEEKVSGMLVGRIGLIHHEEWHEGEGEREVEVGWMLERSRWGRGLATEGALASLGYGFGVLGLARVISIVQPANAASRRVMEKCGLTLHGASRYRAVDVVWYAIDQATWRARQPG